MRIELVSIGNEVLEGMTVNGNGAFLARELSARGYEVGRHIVLPDDIAAIRSGLEEALNRSAFVIATGGLGPTLDDVTREAALPFLSRRAAALENILGTAPGLFDDGLILLPGVPAEMKRMFLEEALPRFLERFPLQTPLYSRICTLCLLRELEVDPFLRTLQKDGLEIGLYPDYGSLRVVFRGSQPLEEQVRSLQDRFYSFFVGEERIEEALHRELTARAKTVALAESCTGGAAAARLVSIPGASQFFLGSIVAYTNEWKEQLLGVRHDTIVRKGAASLETVREMVEGLFSETRADYAAAVSGMLYPNIQDIDPQLVNGARSNGAVFVAIGERGGAIDAGRIEAPPDRSAGLELSVQTVLGALWRRVVHQTPTFS